MVYGDMLNLAVWVKSNAGQGSFYRSQHELVGVFRVGEEPHLNNVELGRHGRSRSNVWHYAGVNTFRAGRLDDLQSHPTVKPVALVADAMKDCTRRGDIVLDTFCGSGTTILVAERVGRHAYTLELEPRFVDVAIKRWQAFSRKDAIHAETGSPSTKLPASAPHSPLPRRLMGADRTHSKKQVRRIANSAKFGFCNPVLIDDDKLIIAGHGRVEAAKLLGIAAVPTCRLSHLSEADKRAYILADNKLAEKAGWDKELLAIELQGLIDLNFEIELTGFELPEIDLILEEAQEAKGSSTGPEDDVPQYPSGPVVTLSGDLWVLGNHRLLCAD